MAVTTARDEEKFDKKPKIGSSGGVGIPEGHSFMTVGHTSTFSSGLQEGVATRSKEEEEKRFKDADKYMKSLKEADKVDVDKIHETQEKEAAKKPTAPGADVAALEAGKGQPAKATEKEEVKTALAQKSTAAEVDPNKVKPK